MSIPATDLLIKSMIEFALQDLRANAWILDDIFSGLASDPLLSSDYGYKEVDAAKTWFLNTEISVLLQWRVADDPPLPAISIAYMPASEMLERTNLADQGAIEDFDPKFNQRTPYKVINNFTPISYDPATGIITIPDKLSTYQMAEGQFWVCSRTGHAFQILEIVSLKEFRIAANTRDDFTDGYVAPASSLWNVHKELSWMNERFSVGCHAQSNPATTMWLWQIVTYCFFRYKEAFLEGRGFELSTVSFSALERNNDFPAEFVYSRYIDVSGQTQVDWIKFIAPKFASVKGGIVIMDGPKAPKGIYGPKGQDWIMESDLPQDGDFNDFIDEDN